MKSKRAQRAAAKPKPAQAQPNYLAKLLALKGAGLLLPGLLRVSVRHDDRCPALRGGVCNCDPEIYLNGVRVEPPVIRRG